MNTDAIRAAQHALGVADDGIWGGRSQAALDAADAGTIAAVQRALGVRDDGAWGPRSQAALDAARGLLAEPGWRAVKASSFADPADVRAFRACKARGGSDQECFRYGDNGIGCWGDDVTTTKIAYVALPPEIMIETWGSVAAAKHREIELTVNGRTITAIVGDRMPHIWNIHNGCGIDLAPGAQLALGLHPPFTVRAAWRPR